MYFYMYFYIVTTGFDTTTSTTGEATQAGPSKLADLVKKIKNQTMQLQKNRSIGMKRLRSSYTVNLGWLLKEFGSEKYTQMKIASGGGTRVVEFPGDADYETVVRKGKELFFPNGLSLKGRLEEFDVALGDFRQTLVIEAEFSVLDYVKKNCLSTKPRIYLMTKRKVSADDDDWDLPDILGLDSGIDNESHMVNQPNHTQAQSADLDQAVNQSSAQLVEQVQHVAQDQPIELLEQDHSSLQGTQANGSPLLCPVCTIHAIDSFFGCGHTLCLICATELKERGAHCHICRRDIITINRLYI
ncbi:E3 ubiquitin-protein ligase RNF8-like [Pecten maximus]|uniref:E3 ubiquitin-protein ligase RNF8-like n=1 Tax=Pecten maximus TaxID=6579 RepID=UPI0014586B7E|nr:E3 ubiquitin-protein ligase RNF8-like [Pecten maximus]